MKSYIVAALVASVSAFPTVLQATGGLAKRDYAKPGCTTSRQCNQYLAISDAQAHIYGVNTVSASRNNCGAGFVCKTFNAQEQYVSQSGAYAYKSPGVNDVSLKSLLSKQKERLTNFQDSRTLPRSQCGS